MNWDTVCISLREATARRTRFANQARSAGLAFEFLEAQDGRDLPGDALGNLGRGAAGCAWSHFEAWNCLLSSDLDALLIIEDDAFPLDSRGLPSALRRECKAMADTLGRWDFLDLFKARRRLTAPSDLGNDWQLMTARGRRGGYQNLGAVAYFISRRGAETMLEHFDLAEPVDARRRDLVESGALAAYYAARPLFGHHKGPSHIMNRGPRRTDRNRP